MSKSLSLRTACLILAAVSPTGTCRWRDTGKKVKNHGEENCGGGRGGVLCGEATKGRVPYQSGRRGQ